jgi:sigma-B regulation protein RsbU (phosphoserine phosphatase)
VETVLRLTNQLTELVIVREKLEELMRSLSLGDELRSDVQLICEEVLANIINHGFDHIDGSQEIQVKFIWTEQSLTLAFEDGGIAFDPLSVTDPNLDDEGDREIGGLGIYLFRQLTSQQEYQRENGRNRLTLTRQIEMAGTN